MDNFLTFFAPPIQQHRKLVVPRNRRMAFLDTTDTGECAAAILLSDDDVHIGQIYHLDNGHDVLRFDEVAELASRALGETITYDGTDEGFERYCGDAIRAYIGQPDAVDYYLHYFQFELDNETVWRKSDIMEFLTGRPAKRLGAPAIELEEHDGVHVLWCSPRTRPGDRQLEQLTRSAPDTVHLAVSDVGFGPEGFFTVARQATDALRALVRMRPAGGAATYRQLALAATLLADPKRAQNFARVVLGPLADDSPEAERLRETLRAYFVCQESKAAASTKLGIHEKTVAYRLRRAAELLGARRDQVVTPSTAPRSKTTGPNSKRP